MRVWPARLGAVPPCCVPSKQDRRLANEPVNATKLAGLSVIEQE